MEEIIKIENHPSDKNNRHWVEPAYRRGDLIKKFFQNKLFKTEEEEIVKSPQNKIPACAVPKTGEPPYDKKIEYLTWNTYTVSA